MEIDPLSPQPKKGWLARLFGGSFSPTVRVIRRSEDLNLLVPAKRAGAVRAAVEQWLAGRGIFTTMTEEDAGEGKVRLKAHLVEADAAKLDVTSDEVQSELEKVLSDSME